MFRGLGFGNGRSRTGRFVGKRVAGFGGPRLKPGGGGVGHHGWIAGTGSHLSAFLSTSPDAALPQTRGASTGLSSGSEPIFACTGLHSLQSSFTSVLLPRLSQKAAASPGL